MRRVVVGFLFCIGLACACTVTRAPDAGNALQGIELASGSPSPFATVATASPTSSPTASDKPLESASPSPSPSASPSDPPTAAPTTASPTKTPSPASSPTATAEPTAPVITTFSPTFGPPGTVVTIIGIRLATVTSVSFGGVRGLLYSSTATTAIVGVPNTAQTGPITLSGPSGSTASAANFLVTDAPPPTAPPQPSQTRNPNATPSQSPSPLPF